MAEPTRSSGTEDTIPASDLDEVAPTSAPAAEDRYKLGTEIGRGGMGRVVEAYDMHLGRTVALKEVLAGSANINKRFAREVRITARLEHASIVPLYDSGLMKDGRPFYVMRRVSGRPLDELMMSARSLEDRLALLPNLLAAMDAIGHAHRRGVIHRDIKPANILVGDLGETVVIDWGLAKVVGEEEPPPPSFEPYVPTAGDSLKTQIGSVFGTPGFMAPEQARGDELDPRSDVYALGATLYQLLAGRPPVGGTSATEMIASTATKRVVPIRKVAPSAPIELATIVDKALSFEPEHRYADASELSEDVRRFTTGQLVGAHRYTRRQRLARFAKRHRAALSVAALAATAVAVLSWVSVHRILKERDTATRARAEAEQQRGIALQNAEQARQRADQLLLASARGLVDTNPTVAIAALKRLESTSPQTLDGARAVAKAAVARGVAWGVRSLPDMITTFEMSRDGKRLLQVNRQGQLQIIDLELRKQVATKDIGKGNRALWVDGGRKILIDRTDGPQLYDPVAGTLEPLGAVDFRELERSPDGLFVAFIDVNNHAGIIDIAKRTTTQVWDRVAERTIAVANDGSWVAFGDRIDPKHSRLVIVDRAGKLLAERAGTATISGVSPSGKLCVSLYQEVVEVRPADPTSTFTKIPLEAKDANLIHLITYRDEAAILVGARGIVTWDRGYVIRGEALADTTYMAQPAANGVLVVSASDFNVHLFRDGDHLVMPIGERPDGMYRVAAAQSSPLVAATTKGAILIWDTTKLFPRTAKVPEGLFLAPRRMLVPDAMMSGWQLWNIDSDTRTPIKAPFDGIPMRYQVLVEESRALAFMQGPRTTSVVAIHGDGKTEIVVDDIGKGLFRIVPGNALVYTLGKNRIFGRVGTETPRELVTLDGEIYGLAATGKLGYAALGSTGELVRGTFGGGNFVRAKVPDLDKGAFIVSDNAGTVFVASGNRLLSWRGTDLREMSRFTVDIDLMAPSEIGLYVQLVNNDIFFVPATGNQTPLRVPLSSLLSLSADGRVAAGVSASAQVEIADMPSLAMWTLPRLAGNGAKVVVSPDGQRVVQSLGAQSVIWKIDPPGSDFAAWLAELTNANEESGHVRWPWQP